MSSSTVTVDLTAASDNSAGLTVERQAAKSTTSVEIQLWNESGMLKTYKTTGDKYEISVSNLRAGYYYIRVIRDGFTDTQTLIVK